MKKIISLFIIFVLIASLLSACGKNKNEPSDGNIDNANTSGELNSDNSNTEATNPEENTENNNGNGDDNVKNPNGSTVNGSTVKAEYGSVVICFGDSITESMGMENNYRYPSILGDHLDGQYEVLNAGVGGEGSFTIATRANAVDFTVSEKIVFAKGEEEVIYDWKIFSGINGEEVKYRYGVMGRELPITKLKIDGKPYTLRYEKGESEESGMYILGRFDASEQLTIPVGAKVEFDYSEIYEKRYCAVVLMGANDGDIDVNVLIDRYKKIAATSEKFIAIIPHYGTDYSAQFTAAFGNACVNLREYCKEQVWVDYNLTKEKVDEVDISAGILPRSFSWERKKGDCHLNVTGYKILGDLVYKKGVELGYWQ